MPTQPIHTLPSKRFVGMISYTLAIALFAAIGIHAQQLREGISVHMATTTNAQPVPAADEDDAWVVTLTADRRLYFGTKLLTPEGLSEQMKVTPRRRDQNLYIKADARAPYADVRKVLEAAKEDAFNAPILLTSQNEHVPAGTMVPAKGLEVVLNQPPAGSEPVVVKVQAGAQSPILTINNRLVRQESLKNTLNHLLQNQPEKIVTVEARTQLPFAQLAQVVDTCRAAGAEVILPTPEL